jgi:hypothetical protein
MTDHSDRNDTSAWPSSSSVERWRHGLLHVTGCSPLEIADRLDILLRFCAGQGVSPQEMIDECRYRSDRMARRRFYLSAACDTRANLVVQSFLVHNGINVFGELVCMPNTLDSVMREQGEQWDSHDRKSSTVKR